MAPSSERSTKLSGAGFAYVSAVPLSGAALTAVLNVDPSALLHTLWPLPSSAADRLLLTLGRSLLSDSDALPALKDLCAAASPEGLLAALEELAAKPRFSTRLDRLVPAVLNLPAGLVRLLELDEFSGHSLGTAVLYGALLPADVVAAWADPDDGPLNGPSDGASSRLRARLLAFAALTAPDEPALRADLVARGLASAPLLPLTGSENIHLALALTDAATLTALLDHYPSSLPPAVLDFVLASAHPDLGSILDDLSSRAAALLPATPAARSTILLAAANPFISSSQLGRLLTPLGIDPSQWPLGQLPRLDLDSSPEEIRSHLEQVINRFDRLGVVLDLRYEITSSVMFPARALAWSAVVRRLVDHDYDQARALSTLLGLAAFDWPLALRPLPARSSTSITPSPPALLPDEFSQLHATASERFGDDVASWERFFALLTRGLTPAEALAVAA